MPLAPDQAAAVLAAANAALAPVEAERDAAVADREAYQREANRIIRETEAKLDAANAEIARLRAQVPAVRAPLQVGLCLSENNDWETDGLWANLFMRFTGWGSNLTDPWKAGAPVPVDADGSPLNDAACYSLCAGYPAGRGYSFRMEGSGVPVFSRGARFATAPVRDGSAIAGEAELLGNGAQVCFRITGIDPSNPPRNFRLIVPGLPADTARVTNPAFAAAVAPFGGPLRVVVGPQRLNVDEAGTVADFAARVRPDEFPQTGRRGVALELLIDAANECGKDIYLAVPDRASDAYVSSLGDLLAARLAPGRRAVVGYSNEAIFNTRFPQWRRVHDDAKANPDLTAADENIRHWQQCGWQARRLGLILKPKLGNRVGVVVGGQASWAWNDAARVAPGPAEVALDYIAARFGPPSQWIDAIEIALYRDAGSDGSSVDAILAGIDRSLADADLRAKDARHRAVASKYGLKLLAYESAVTVRGRQAAAPDPRDAVQTLPAMGERVTALLAYAEEAGFDGLEYYYAIGKLDGQSEGRYPLARDLASFAASPKAQAAVTFARQRQQP